MLAALVWATLFSIVYIAPAFFRWAPEAFVAAGGLTWVLSTLSGYCWDAQEQPPATPAKPGAIAPPR